MERGMDELLEQAERVAAILKARGETISVAESSTGGLISAALLSVGGASAYFVGGAVVYTRTARASLMDITREDMVNMRPSTPAYASLIAERIKVQNATVWGVGESGATGPAGNGYGDAAGHCCIGLAGPRHATITLETGHGDRRRNMFEFARRALELVQAEVALA